LQDKTKAYIQIHISVLLWGFTAILGKLIELKETPLIWFRLLLISICLLLIPGLLKKTRLIPQTTLFKLAGIGSLISIHWLCFYGSIKYANVSVALSCLATTSFFTSFIEPLILKKKIKKYELLLGLFVIPGIYLIFYFTSLYITGIILGLLAAVLCAVFVTLNKKISTGIDPLAVTLTELGSGFITVTLLMPLYFVFFPEASMHPSSKDWFYLIILSIFCTILPFSISIRALNHISAFTVNLTLNLEPVYGIIMAIIFFQENKELNYGFYLGTLIILISVFLHPYLNKKFD
jgi:drug/metabolite transporter (DMT)-like permease